MSVILMSVYSISELLTIYMMKSDVLATWEQQQQVVSTTLTLFPRAAVTL